MAQILKMNLKYKGKDLNYVTSQNELKSKFYIGSDKHLFWQILDKSFPAKHKFVTRKGKDYVAHLKNNMKVSVNYNDQELSNVELKSKGIMKGDELYLRPGYTGTIALAPDWEVDFKYFQKKRKKISKEELRVIKKFSRWSPWTKEERFTRIFLLLAFIFTLAGSIAFDIMYEPPVRELTFEDYSSEALGASIEDWIENKVTEEEVVQETKEEAGADAEEAEETPKEEPTPQQTQQEAEAAEVAEATAELSSFLSANLGDTTEDDAADAGAGEDLFAGNNVQVINQLGELTAAAVGNQSGNTNNNANASGNLFKADPGQLGVESNDIGDAGLGDLFSKGQLEETTEAGGFDINIAGFDTGMGQAGEIKTVTPNQVKARIAEAKRKMASVKVISEDDIKSGKVQVSESSAIGIVRNRVNTFKSRIMKIYNTQFQFSEMYGSLKITLYVEPSSVVAEVEPAPGSKFDDDFIDAVKSDIAGSWKFPVSENVVYPFIMRFSK